MYPLWDGNDGQNYDEWEASRAEDAGKVNKILTVVFSCYYFTHQLFDRLDDSLLVALTP